MVYSNQTVEDNGEDRECGDDFGEDPGAVRSGMCSGRVGEVDAVESCYKDCGLGCGQLISLEIVERERR
jgi:hypothetical protein